MAVEYAASKTVDKNNDSSSIRLRKLKELVRDTSDLFFQIQGDGSMIIWGIQVHNTNFTLYIPASSSKSLLTIHTLSNIFRTWAKTPNGFLVFSWFSEYLSPSLHWNPLSSCETLLHTMTQPWRDQEVVGSNVPYELPCLDYFDVLTTLPGDI